MSAYVQIIVAKPLSQDQLVQWFKCVQQSTPSGLISSTHMRTGKSVVDSQYYKKITKNKKHAYVIPLVRDLDMSEVHQILKSWCEIYPQGDFTFDYSQTIQHTTHGDMLTQNKWDQILDAWGKCQHQKWLKRHGDQGWRYGVNVSTKDKTHPWMQPWESLPHAARELNLQGVKDLMNILEDFGYAIVQVPKS